MLFAQNSDSLDCTGNLLDCCKLEQAHEVAALFVCLFHNNFKSQIIMEETRKSGDGIPCALCYF